MNNEEAKKLLRVAIQKYRDKTYSELELLVESDLKLQHSHHEEIKIKNSAQYQIQITAIWDDKKKKNIRVIGTIDDGGWRAFIPLTEDFIVNKNGEYIDE